MTRHELHAMQELAARLVAVGEAGILSTLFWVNGSTYRPLGSMMVSGPGSLMAGGISGGCLEEYIARQGREMTRNRRAAILGFDTLEDDGKPVLGCGGSIEVLVERLTADHVDFLRQAAMAAMQNTPSTISWIIDEWDEATIGIERFFLSEDSAAISERRIRRLREQSLHLRRSSACLLNSDRRALMQYIPAMRRLIVFGAGNDVPPLCSNAIALGWHVSVVHYRERLANSDRFGDADAVIAAPWKQAVEQLRFTPHTAVVLMTHSVADDIEILSLLRERPMGYLGALGPEHRRQWLLDGVAQSDSYNNVAQMLRGPIGLNLGDRSAAGIAVSIMSEILAVMNERDAAPLSPATRAPHETDSHLVLDA